MSTEKQNRKEKKIPSVMPKAPTPTALVFRRFELEFSNRIASIDIAEKWDNVGFLVESPRASSLSELRIMTCIDLTGDVVTEATKKQCNLILAYHPVLFRATHSLSMANHASILRCVDSGISVFSPHTALDNTSDGMNDFLCDMFRTSESKRSEIRLDVASGAQVGRLSILAEPLSLHGVINILKSKLGVDSIRYACASHESIESVQISSIGVCVGSGSSVLMNAPADLYLTGEMTHHDILACVAVGKSVILLDHSSSERPFLPELAKRLREFEDVSEVFVSESDREPIRVA
jgi:dinuclear metal center YbgI/SA1388 family protein